MRRQHSSGRYNNNHQNHQNQTNREPSWGFQKKSDSDREHQQTGPRQYQQHQRNSNREHHERNQFRERDRYSDRDRNRRNLSLREAERLGHDTRPYTEHKDLGIVFTPLWSFEDPVSVRSVWTAREIWFDPIPRPNCNVLNPSDQEYADVQKQIQTLQNGLSKYDRREMDPARSASNPYELIKSLGLRNRSAVKALEFHYCLRRFGLWRDDWHTVTYADVGAGPGGFSEYMQARYKWRARGFGFTLRIDKRMDFDVQHFHPAAYTETFHAIYGEDRDPGADGDFLKWRNRNAYIERVRGACRGSDIVSAEDDKIGVMIGLGDCGFDVQGHEEDEEEAHVPHLAAQLRMLYRVLAIKAPDGHETFLVCKFKGGFHPMTHWVFRCLKRAFAGVGVIRPIQSRPANSERYVVACGKKTNADAVKAMDELEQYLQVVESEFKTASTLGQRIAVLKRLHAAHLTAVFTTATDNKEELQRFAEWCRYIAVHFSKQQLVGLQTLHHALELSRTLPRNQTLRAENVRFMVPAEFLKPPPVQPDVKNSNEELDFSYQPPPPSDLTQKDIARFWTNEWIHMTRNAGRVVPAPPPFYLQTTEVEKLDKEYDEIDTNHVYNPDEPALSALWLEQTIISNPSLLPKWSLALFQKNPNPRDFGSVLTEAHRICKERKTAFVLAQRPPDASSMSVRCNTWYVDDKDARATDITQWLSLPPLCVVEVIPRVVGQPFWPLIVHVDDSHPDEGTKTLTAHLGRPERLRYPMPVTKEDTTNLDQTHLDPNFTCSLQPALFESVKSGQKTIEVRIRRGKFADWSERMVIGVVLDVADGGDNKQTQTLQTLQTEPPLRRKIVKIDRFASFDQLFSWLGIDKKFQSAGFQSLEQAKQMYEQQLYSSENDRNDIRDCGLVAFTLSTL